MSKKEHGLSPIESIATENLQTIAVEVEDFDFEKLGNFLEATSYIQLAAERYLPPYRKCKLKTKKFTCMIDFPELSVMICKAMLFI